MPATQQALETWGTAVKFMVVLEIAGLKHTELGAYCRERSLYYEQEHRWRQAAQYANAQPQVTMAEQKDPDKRHQQDQRELSRLQQKLRQKDRALAAAAAQLLAAPKFQALWGEQGDA